jgi:hypothetical protein
MPGLRKEVENYCGNVTKGSIIPLSTKPKKESTITMYFTDGFKAFPC